MATMARSHTLPSCGDRRSTTIGNGLKLLHLMLLLLLMVMVVMGSGSGVNCTFQKTCRREKEEMELDCICEEGQLTHPDLTWMIINHDSGGTRFSGRLVAALNTDGITPNLKEKNVTVHTMEFKPKNNVQRSKLTIVLNNVKNDELQARYWCVVRMLDDKSHTTEGTATYLEEQGCTITTTSTMTTTTAMVIRTEDPPTTTQPYTLPSSNGPTDGMHGMTTTIIVIIVSVSLLVVIVVVIICFAKGQHQTHHKDGHSRNKNCADRRRKDGRFSSNHTEEDSDTHTSLMPAQPGATADRTRGDDQRWKTRQARSRSMDETPTHTASGREQRQAPQCSEESDVDTRGRPRGQRRRTRNEREEERERRSSWPRNVTSHRSPVRQASRERLWIRDQVADTPYRHQRFPITSPRAYMSDDSLDYYHHTYTNRRRAWDGVYHDTPYHVTFGGIPSPHAAPYTEDLRSQMSPQHVVVGDRYSVRDHHMFAVPPSRYGQPNVPYYYPQHLPYAQPAPPAGHHAQYGEEIRSSPGHSPNEASGRPRGDSFQARTGDEVFGNPAEEEVRAERGEFHLPPPGLPPSPNPHDLDPNDPNYRGRDPPPIPPSSRAASRYFSFPRNAPAHRAYNIHDQYPDGRAYRTRDQYPNGFSHYGTEPRRYGRRPQYQQQTPVLQYERETRRRISRSSEDVLDCPRSPFPSPGFADERGENYDPELGAQSAFPDRHAGSPRSPPPLHHSPSGGPGLHPPVNLLSRESVSPSRAQNTLLNVPLQSHRGGNRALTNIGELTSGNDRPRGGATGMAGAAGEPSRRPEKRLATSGDDFSSKDSHPSTGEDSPLLRSRRLQNRSADDSWESSDTDNAMPAVRGRQISSSRDVGVTAPLGAVTYTSREVDIRDIKTDNETRRKRPISAACARKDSVRRLPVVCAADVAEVTSRGSRGLKRKGSVTSSRCQEARPCRMTSEGRGDDGDVVLERPTVESELVDVRVESNEDDRVEMRTRNRNPSGRVVPDGRVENLRGGTPQNSERASARLDQMGVDIMQTPESSAPPSGVTPRCSAYTLNGHSTSPKAVHNDHQ